MSKSAFDLVLAECVKADGPAHVPAPSLSAEEAGRLAADLNGRGTQARVLDGAKLFTKADLLRALAAAFAFPSYFGDNWDAVIDCLSDLSWLPASGYVCIFLHADAFRSADAEAHDMFLTVAEDVARRWRDRGEGMFFKLVRVGKPNA